MLVSLGEGGEAAFGTNINYFTEEFGIACNSDAVVRTVYYKYLHPKEVHIGNGVLNRGINVAAGKRPTPATGASAAAIAESSRSNLAFAYPYGERRRRRRRHRHSGASLPLSPRRLPRRQHAACTYASPGASSPHAPFCLPLTPSPPPILRLQARRSTWRSRRTRCSRRGTSRTLSTGRSARSGRRRRTAGSPRTRRPRASCACSAPRTSSMTTGAPRPRPRHARALPSPDPDQLRGVGWGVAPPSLPRRPPSLDAQRRSSVSAAPRLPPLLPRTHAVLRPCRAVPHRAVPCPSAHPPGWTRTRTGSWSTCCSSG